MVFICPVQYGAQRAKGRNNLYLFDFNHHPSWTNQTSAACGGESYVCELTLSD